MESFGQTDHTLEQIEEALSSQGVALEAPAREAIRESLTRAFDEMEDPFAPHSESVIALPEPQMHPSGPVAPRPLSEAPTPEPLHQGTDGEARVGRYIKEALLGRGGMGEIHKVRDARLNRPMALKIIRPERQGQSLAIARFIEEAQITAQLQHPGVVPVHELGRLNDGRFYFTMKAIKGRTLNEVIDGLHQASTGDRWQTEPGGWTLRRVLDAFHRLCETVAYAHDRQVVHRDIKPSNLMVGGYGEVLVLDWGLAKVLNTPDTVVERADAEPELSEAEEAQQDPRATRVITTGRSTDQQQTRIGTVAGTPVYMPPEQATGDLTRISPASDVFALGIVLYEILAGQLPFVEENWMARRILGSEIRPIPHNRPVDEDLLQLALKAMAFRIEDRFANASALATALSAWLEGAQARARAEEKLAQAADRLPELKAVRDQADRLRAQAAAQAPHPLAPEEAKQPAWDLEDQAEALEREALAASVDFSESVQAALADAPDLAGAHALLADHYQAEHAAAEARGDQGAADRFEALLKVHDDGRYATYLEGDGTLTLATNPPGATVEAFRYVLKGRRLQLESHGVLGTTPLDRVRLPMGSYRLTLTAEGREPVYYPIQIERGAHFDGRAPEGGKPWPIPLLPEGSLGPDERYVPGGWFVSGGDVASFGIRSMLPRRRLWLDGFIIQRHHVTIGMVVDFLNDLVAQGREEEALACAPRANEGGPDAPSMLGRDDEGRFFIPPNNPFGVPWRPEWPAIFVDWHSANAYARWQAARDDRPWRLPHEMEWEKAARGVDGRLFPWGDQMDPTWCVMLESHMGLPTMDPAGTNAVDESPYGVMDLAGNQKDWCYDAASPEGPAVSEAGRIQGPVEPTPDWAIRQSRGGNFLDPVILCRSNLRASLLAHVRDYRVSFRLARPVNPS